MSTAHLLLKYNGSLLCELIHNRLDLINIPPYSNSESFSNISVFVSLLLNGLIDESFNATASFNFFEWEKYFDLFVPDYLYYVDNDVYIYDIDALLADYPELKDHIDKSLSQKPKNIVFRPLEFLHRMYQESLKVESDEYIPEEQPYTYNFSKLTEYLSINLSHVIPFLYTKRTDKDVLLLYSGGKDSTLSAIRLHNAGYNVHFIHFDNGHMKDTDKPYLTYCRSFNPDDGYFFSYLHKSVDIKWLFKSYYESYESKNQDPALLSEIRCLSCRMAMYTEALRIAKNKGYKYIADGARISQKFLLEQPVFLKHLEALAASYDIKLLFPVLELTDDQEEIKELLANGQSAKTWESKCTIGTPAKDKTKEDEETLISFYKKSLKPRMENNINYPL